MAAVQTFACARREKQLCNARPGSNRRAVQLLLGLVLATPYPVLAKLLCEPASSLNVAVAADIIVAGEVAAPWTNETPRELRSVETIEGRAALRADLRQWSPVAVKTSGQIPSADYDAMELWLRASRTAPPLSVLGSPGVVCSLDALMALQANTWQRLQVPLASLGYTGNEPIGRLQLKSRVSDAYTVWVSGWRLIKRVDATVPDETEPVDPDQDTRPTPPPMVPPPSGAIDLSVWQRDPGVDGEIDDHMPDTRVRLLANGDDLEDDTRAFQEVLARTATGGGVIEIPAGTFYLSASLQLGSRQVLRGEGSGRTRLIFARSLNQGIEIGGGYPGAPIEVFSARKGSSSITVRMRDALRGAAFGLLTQTGKATSQIVRIVRVQRADDRAVVMLEEPLNATFPAGSSFQVFAAAEHAGIEQLSLDVATRDVRIGDMIRLRSAANSWIRDVVSRQAFGAHVFTRQSYHCEIRDSLFDDATGHHDGKQGYGIDLANATTACLVENNTLRRLRHSILLQEGANGNVVARNHSREPRHTNFARGGPGDISFHGAANANLIESNVVERIHLGDAGAVGAGNAVLRNCLTSGPLTVENVPAVQYLAGNALYGSDARLMDTFMPPVLPELLQSRPYLLPGENLFDEDGIVLTSLQAVTPVARANWHAGRRWSQGTPDASALTLPRTLFGSNQPVFLDDPISGYWPEDCRIPAVGRLDDRD